jgi:branched-chain amino acid transport system substrate-binding protein
MPIRRFSLAVLCAVACLLLAACGGEPVPSPTLAGSDGPAALATDGASALRACREDPFGCVEIPEGAPIVIGTALTLTGPAASIGLDAQYGAQVAVNFRGDVRGHPVELRNEDDRCTADGGTAAADLLRAEGVIAVIGTTCSAAALPAGQLLGQDGILLVSPSATAPELTEPDLRPPFFVRLAPNDLAQAAAMARFACEELGIDTAATVHDGTDFATQLESAFTDEFEGECRGTVTERAGVDSGLSGASAALERIARSADDGPPELLYVPFLGEHGGRLVRRALGTSGLQDIVLAGIRTGLDERADPAFLRRAGAAAEGMYLSGADLAVGGDFYETAFLEAYRDVSGADEPLATAHAQAFDAANLVLDAIAEIAVEADGLLYVPRSRLRDAVLDTREYHGLSGVLSCGPEGDCAGVTPAIWQFDGEAMQRVWP